jgi:hypothetical protein
MVGRHSDLEVGFQVILVFVTVVRKKRLSLLMGNLQISVLIPNYFSLLMFFGFCPGGKFVRRLPHVNCRETNESKETFWPADFEVKPHNFFLLFRCEQAPL